MNREKLIEEARRASQKAYAPYSGFKVGCALLTEDGQVYTGCNVENATYGATICAERVAVSKAVSDGQLKFSQIALYTETDHPVTPCGICRQVLHEFAPEVTVISACKTEEVQKFKLSDLLPYAFVFNKQDVK